MELDDRDVATLVWLAVLATWATTHRDVRSAAIGVWRAFWQPAMASMAFAYAGFVALCVFTVYAIGLWRVELVKDTLEWFIGAFGLLIATGTKGGTRHFFRSIARATVGWGVLLAFYINLRPLPLAWELVLQPLLFLLVGMSALADARDEYRSVRGPLHWVLGLIGLTLMVLTARDLIGTFPDFAIAVRQFLLPIWLTVAVIPFLYALSLLMNYQLAFLRLNLNAVDGRASWRARLALLVGLGANDGEVHDFVGSWLVALANARTFSAARQVVRDYRTSRRRGSNPGHAAN